jgi:hypothetical protein
MSLCISFIASLVMHSLTRLTSKVLYIAKFHTQTIISFLCIIFLEHNLCSKFRLVSSMDLIKFQIVFMQEEMSKRL